MGNSNKIFESPLTASLETSDSTGLSLRTRNLGYSDHQANNPHLLLGSQVSQAKSVSYLIVVCFLVKN